MDDLLETLEKPANMSIVSLQHLDWQKLNALFKNLAEEKSPPTLKI